MTEHYITLSNLPYLPVPYLPGCSQSMTARPMSIATF